MRVVFADTAYWVALSNPHDQWHGHFVEASKALGDFHAVTTDEVLTEFLNLFSGFGGGLRTAAVAAAREIMANPRVRVLPQTWSSFLKGMELYAKRQDKAYSLVDCISMVVMEEEGMEEILSTDGHFRQAGFRLLPG